MDEVKISSSADFLALAKARRLAKAQPLTLPSGLVLMVQRPDMEWWMRNVGRLPSSIANRIVPGGNPPQDASWEDLVELSRWTTMMISEVIVSPVVKLNPGSDELDPHLISDEDLNHIMRFAGGEIAADGQGLDKFPGGSGAAPAPRSTG